MPSDLSSLLRASSITDHQEVLNAANAVLKSNKTDLTAQRTRIVALLKLDRFDDALRVILEAGIKLEAACTVEKAYALYKLNKLEDASVALTAAGLTRRSLSHVAAQVAYRSERFDEVENIYSRLLESGAAEEESDIQINLRAAKAQAEWQGRAAPAPLSEQPPDAFEVCYNAACAHIAQGNLDVASNFLQRAVMLCDASEELSDAEKEAEIRPIRAQQAYVFARLGKTKQALDIYQSLGTTEDSDPDFIAVAQNNLASLDSNPANPYLLQRKAAAWDPTRADAKLFKYQSNALARNSLLVDLDARKIDGVKERTHRILQRAQQPSTRADINTISIVNAAAEVQGKTGKEALRELSDLSAKRPNDLGPVLTIIQIQLQESQGGAALAVLDAYLKRLDESKDVAVQDVRFSPGLVALTVSLLRHQGRQASAKAELVRAAKHWRDRPTGASASLLREAGIELLHSSNPEDLALAASSFEKLFAEQQGSHIASAGLVASLAASDASKVEQQVKELPPVEQLTTGLDIEALIHAGIATLPKSASAIAAASRKRPADDAAGADKATSKRRKRKLPKSYIEGKAPDPERWLPLRDRSSYRPPKGKKGKKKAADTTQGGVVKDEETLGLVGGGGVKVEKAQANKKKKKGKK